jgi:hypothetical protein
MTNHAVQSGRHSRADRGKDLYETPTCATEALLRAEQLPHTIFEAAAGRGAIVKVLRDRGHAVIASDIIQRDFPLHFVADFLTRTQAPAGCECILTNPPFGIINEFIAHALDLAPRVIMLAPLSLMASARRAEIMERRGLARIHVFAERLPFMHRADWTGPKASNAINHAWFVWDRDHVGPIILDRISIHPTTPNGAPVTRRKPTLKANSYGRQTEILHRSHTARSDREGRILNGGVKTIPGNA